MLKYSALQASVGRVLHLAILHF